MVKAQILLRRPSDGMASEPHEFQFTPLGRPGNLLSMRRALARKKTFDCDLFNNDVELNNNFNVNQYFANVSNDSKSRLLLLRALQGKNGVESRGSQTFYRDLDDDATIVPERNNQSRSDLFDYGEVNKWVQQSREVEVKEPALGSDTASLSNSLSAADKCLDELLSQVVELDKIYEDTQARIVHEREGMTVETGIDVHDNQTYTSLQLAMKNPMWVHRDSSVTGVAARENSLPPRPAAPKRDVDVKVPPLPPKRIRKAPSLPVLSMHHAPDKNLPSSPKSKPGLLSKLFSRKSKKDVVSPSDNLSVLGNNNSLMYRDSMPPVRAMAKYSGDETPPYGAELVDVEHYALYTALAPRATDSEFDEMSFYYSPVEGGKVLLDSKQSG